MINENEHEIGIAEQHEDTSQLHEQEQHEHKLHEQHSTSSYLSELIVKSVLDKLITNAVLQEYILMTEEKVGDHCFTFIKKSLNQFLEQRFFPYEFNLDANNNEYFYDDDDDVDNANANTTSTMYYNCVHPHISNTWIEIIEPEAQATDRNTTSKMKITKNFTEDLHTLSDDEQQVTLNTKEPEPSSLPNNYMPSRNDIVHEEKEKETISMNNTLTQSKHQTEKLIIKAKNTIPSSSKRKLKLNNTKQTNDNTVNNVNSDNDNDNDKIPPIDLPSYDLPESMFYNKYIEQDNTAEINHMRKEFEAEKHRKEEEIKQEQALQLKKKRAALVAANYNKKEIDTNHYTFDSSGKVIPLKHQNVELLAKEFWWAKPFIKGGIQRLGSIFRPKIERKGSYKVLSPNKKGKDNNNKDKRRKKSHGDADIIRRGVFLEDTNNNNKGKANVNVNTEVIRNDDRVKHPNDYYDIRYSKMKHIKKGPIVTSGNNYSLITPEIGVIITQDDKHKKEGGFEFSQKFNKPSMFEFSRLAMESERYNSQRYLLSSMSIDSQSVNGLNSYIGYKKQFGSENPLIQNANVRDDDSRVTSSYKLPSLYQSANYNYNNKLFMNSEMKLTNVDIPHVKYVLDDIGGVESGISINTQMKGKAITNENIFRNQRRRRKDDQLYLNTEPINTNNYIDEGNYMDKFNTKIIRNKYWGNNQQQQQPTSASTNSRNGGGDYVNTKSWKKPNKRINIKELGYSIAMTKMPRDRRLYKSVVLSNGGYNK